MRSARRIAFALHTRRVDEKDHCEPVGAVILVAVAAGAQGRQAAPLEAVRVGDWLSFKLSGRGQFTGTLKQTLIAINDATATIKTEQTMGAKPLPAKETKMSLVELRDPLKIAAKLDKAKIEEGASGKEDRELNGKKLACDWRELKVSYGEGQTPIISSKVWTSPQIPLTGLVRLENEAGGVKTVIELVDYGGTK